MVSKCSNMKKVFYGCLAANAAAILLLCLTQEASIIEKIVLASVLCILQVLAGKFLFDLGAYTKEDELNQVKQVYQISPNAKKVKIIEYDEDDCRINEVELEFDARLIQRFRKVIS